MRPALTLPCASRADELIGKFGKDLSYQQK
jgi:hypothetical protein